jgi:hypothetical protein
MKKLVIAVFVFMVLGSYFYYSKESCIDILSGIKSGSYSLHVDVPESDGSSVIFTKVGNFDNKKFTGAGFDIKNSSSKGSVMALLDEIEPLGMKQFLLPFFVNYGGSGTFLYIGLFDIVGTKTNHLDSLFIGDRVELLNLSATDNIEVLLEYNGYKEGKSMSTIPDELRKLNLLIKGKKLLKVSGN